MTKRIGMYSSILATLLLGGCGTSTQINSNPQNAKVYVQNSYAGQTPSKVKVDFGKSPTANLKINKDGFKQESITLAKQNLAKEYNFNLSPIVCNTIINTNAKSAIVIVDGDEKGSTPLTSTLVFGNKTSYSITLQKDGFKSADYNIAFNNCSDETMIKMEPITKELTINSQPSEAIVLVNGENVGVTPLTHNFVFGNNTNLNITVQKFGFQDKSENLTLDYELNSMMFSLERKSFREMGYTNQEVDEKTGDTVFKMFYERAYQDTIELSPSAANVQQVIRTDNINMLIGGLDVKNQKLVYEAIYPFAEVNSDERVKMIVSLKDVIRNVHSILNKEDNFLSSKSQIISLVDLKLINEQKYNSLVELLSRTNTIEDITKYQKMYQELLFSYEQDLINYTTMDVKDFYSEIWLTDTVVGSRKSRITTNDTKSINSGPAIDGEHVYFASNRNSNVFDIWRTSLEGGSGLTKINNSPYSQDIAPSIRHNGQGELLAYTSVPLGSVNEQVWTINKKGYLPSQLKDGKEPSMNGGKIAYVKKSKVSGKYQIWIMNEDGSNDTLLSDDKVNSTNPSLSPDAKWIAYTSDVAGNKDIWIMSTDGTYKTQLTTNPSVDMNPAWDEEGNIFFISNRGMIWGIWRLKPKDVTLKR